MTIHVRESITQITQNLCLKETNKKKKQTKSNKSNTSGFSSFLGFNVFCRFNIIKRSIKSKFDSGLCFEIVIKSIRILPRPCWKSSLISIEAFKLSTQRSHQLFGEKNPHIKRYYVYSPFCVCDLFEWLTLSNDMQSRIV